MKKNVRNVSKSCIGKKIFNRLEDLIGKQIYMIYSLCVYSMYYIS